MSDRCNTCRFYKQGYRTGKGHTERNKWLDTGILEGDCRIRSTADSFPRRLFDDWCGEHKPSPTTPERTESKP